MSKTQLVLAHLKEYGTITSWDAIRFYGATRLSAIIFDLRKRGYNIDTKMIDFEDRYGNRSKMALYKLS